MSPLNDLRKLVLRRTPDGDAYWTSDIAYDCRLPTPRVRTALKALQKDGLVETIVVGTKGLPTSWRRTAAGTELVGTFDEASHA